MSLKLISPSLSYFFFFLMWLLEKFKLHMWLTLAVCILFLLECPGLEYKVLEEVRKVVGDEAGEAVMNQITVDQ